MGIKNKMKKSIILALFSLFIMSSSHAAVEVANESKLNEAISKGETDILLTGSFETTKDLNIPSGRTLTLAENVVITVRYKWDSGKGKIDDENTDYITGGGTIITGKKLRIKKTASKTLPTTKPFPSPAQENTYSGATYEVTEIHTEVKGGTIKYTDISQIEGVNASYHLS